MVNNGDYQLLVVVNDLLLLVKWVDMAYNQGITYNYSETLNVFLTDLQPGGTNLYFIET